MQAGTKLSLEQIRAFLESSEEIRSKGQRRAEVYAWVTRTLREQGYGQQGRGGKGLLRQYLGKMTGLSRAQITRLLGRYRQAGEVKEALYRRQRFPQRYTRRDVERLAAVDEAHDTLSGPATRRILEREFEEFGRPEYERLAEISVAQIDLPPAPTGRLSPALGARHQDAAHRGVDWGAAAARPARPTRLSAGGHVEKLLHKLLIEQTKSRPRHSNDNGLVASKNGAVIRKHLGYSHIAASHAACLQHFFVQHFNPYLNFHRPCGQPELVTNAKGKQKRVYRRYATPCEVLQQLPDAVRHLKPGQSLLALAQMAATESDTQAARRMQEAKRRLFASFQPEKRGA